MQRGAEQLHVVELLFAEGIGGDDVEGVAFHRADQRQGDAGAAAGILDDRTAGFETPVGFRRLDHRERHPVLHAAGGVLVLGFEQEAGAVGGADMAQGDQRRVADAVEDGAGLAGHGFCPKKVDPR